MDFTFDEDQIALRDSVSRFLMTEAAPEMLREIWETQEGRSPELRAKLAEQGLLGLSVPEAEGGLGLGDIDWALTVSYTHLDVYKRQVLGVESKELMGIVSIDTGVFGGIVIGGIAAALFNRYYRINLPSYLGFFAGKRFVPIVTAFAAIGLGVALSFVWPPIGAGIKGFSHWAAESNPALAFTIYGVIERLLVPFGLHHIWNCLLYTSRCV